MSQHEWRAADHAAARRGALDRPSTSCVQDAQDLVARAREHARHGAVAEALVAYDMALGVVQNVPPSPLHADLLRARGALLFAVGRTGEAASLHRKSLDVAQHIRYEPGIAHAQAALALVEARRGNGRLARQLFDDASMHAAAAGESRLYAIIERHVAALSAELGDAEDASTRLGQSLRAFRDAGDVEGLALTLGATARLHARRGRFAEARQAVEEALAYARRARDVQLEAAVRLAHGEVLVAEGRLAEAAPEVEQVLSAAVRCGDRVRRAAALRLHAVLAADSDAARARESLDEALSLATASEDALLTERVRLALGDLAWRAGDALPARAHWTEALAVARRCGAVHDVDELERRLAAPG